MGGHPFVALMSMILPKACLTLGALAVVWKAFRLCESEGFLWSHIIPKISKEHFPLAISWEVSKILLGTDASKASRPREANSMCRKICHGFNQICMYEQP